MDPFGGYGVLIVAGVVAVLGLIAYFTCKSYTGIEVSTVNVTLAVGERVTMTAAFKRKNWLLGHWQYVPGSFQVRTFHLLNPVVIADPVCDFTKPAAPKLTATLTGLAPGCDTLRISGTPIGDTNVESADIIATVKGG